MIPNKTSSILKNSIYKVHVLILTVSLCLVFGCAEESTSKQNKKDPNILSLAGEWTVKLDSLNIGKTENWQNSTINGQLINLPGTLDESGIGKKSTLKPALNNYVLSSLNRKFEYYGKAWYQKTVNIPTEWTGKAVLLELERVLWESEVFVNGTSIGKQESLIGSHIYDLTELIKSGENLVTVTIDNSDKYPFINVLGDRYPEKVDQEMAHAYTNHTQIKWNGILGKIELRASDKSAPRNLQVYPHFNNNSITVSFEQPSNSGKTTNVSITDAKGTSIFSKKIEKLNVENNILSFSIAKPDNLALWDEFNPNTYNLKVTSESGSAETVFGFRKIHKDNGVLKLNDNRIFLRGNLECVIFPKTGYPPMSKKEWANLYAQAKNYGLNHLRFHSWCPPKAAFEAADEMGIYLQVELPHWSLKVGEDKKTTQYLYAEAHKILKDYGNHPSFIFMSMGNELQGDIQVLNDMTASLKTMDNRHLYATTSFSFQQPTGTRPEVEDEYFIAQWTDKGWIRGQGVFNSKSPNFSTDYTKNMAHIEVPLISHEIGQYSVYPDLSEIPKYTGVLEPLNFVAVKNDLEKKGLIDLAPDFTNASGKLAAMLYKEEIERALKTHAFDGFQLLQLQDFPGQGTALVGLLNAFWESKGVISGKEFRQFNSEVVPLLRFEKAIYSSDENFTADIEIANFFKPLNDQNITWSITDSSGKTLKSGELSSNLAIGNNGNLGKIDTNLPIEKPEKLTVTLELNGTDYKNSWHIWIYPKNQHTTTENIVITASFDVATKALENGKKVLLSPNPKDLSGVTGRFVPVFWSPVHFPDQPATMGLLIDNEHNAFNAFPTETHTEWQWWDLCIQSKSLDLKDFKIKPLVRVIDNFVTNRNLANLFEVKIGKGELMFSSIDLISDIDERPAANQLLYSLTKYMDSDNFKPETEMTLKDLKAIALK